MNKKSIILMVAGGGCFLLFACCALAGIGYYFLDMNPETLLSDEPHIDNVSVELNDAVQAKVGDQFVLEVDVTNSGNDSRILDSIDLETTYLEGVTVTRVEPDYNGYDHVVFMTEDFSTYDFQRAIPGGSTETIKFYMTANKAGNYFGWVDVCIDSAVDCNRYDAMISVGE